MAEPVNVTKMPTPARMPVAVDVNNPVALYLDTGVFEQLQRVAKLMASSSIVPPHLQGADKVSDCFLVVAQAFRWGMDPFSVASHSFVYQKKMGYEGKLIASVVNASGRLKGNLDYRYEGAGDARKVTVTGQFKEEATAREIEGTVKDWKTANEKWRVMTDQMLAYRGAREWARRHMPEVILGVNYADDEIPQMNIGPERAIDVTPRATPKDLDAALEAADESGRSPVANGASPAVVAPDENPVGAREGTDSAATKLDVKATAKLIPTLSAEQLAAWKAANTTRVYELKPVERAPILAAIQVREGEIANG